MRHNRTLLAIGSTAHNRIQSANICIIGANPLGVEILKTFLLFGVNKISIFDDSPVNESDIKANMFLTNNDIGKPKMPLLIQRMNKLNPSATILNFEEKPNEKTIKEFTILIITSHISFSEICFYNILCRQNQIGFAVCDTYSFSGFFFVDFGQDFLVENVNGKPPQKFRIQQISNSNPGIIRFTGKELPDLPPDSFIHFEELTSMTELNLIDNIHLHIEDGIASIECDTTAFSPFDSFNPNGFAVQVKEPILLHFSSYSDSLESPFYSLFRFSDKHQNIRTFYLNRQKNEYPNGNIDLLYFSSTTTLIASLVSNECIKFITHHLLPMNKQWFLYNKDELFNVESKETNISCLKKLKNINAAVIGVGATGCEISKLLALNDVKSLTLIDSDNIETTNLNRQVLFSDDDVGKNKAEAAASTIHGFSPNMNIKTYPYFVNDETKTIFTNAWLKQFDVVWSMVDSFGAREYIDKRCSLLSIPNFTGGINKTSADWQSMIPHYTQRFTMPYSDSSNNETPSCTLKLFPHRQEHCIEWAHHQFNRILHKTGLNSFDECIQFACNFFIHKFNHKIRDLQYFHPKDEEIAGVKGSRYWSNHRIYPAPLSFDANNKYCLLLIKTIVLLVSKNNNIEIDQNDIDFVKLANMYNKENWTPPNDTSRTSFEDNDNNSNSPNIEDLFQHDNEVHIDFIQAAANLRSQNYGLGEIDRLFTQSHAGKIESALCTTASICSASLFHEFIISLIKPESLCIGKYNSSPFSYTTMKEPVIPKFKFGNTTQEFSQWDFLHYQGNQTLLEVQNDIELKAKTKLFIWSSNDGKILPVNGQRSFGLQVPVESTFYSIFDSSLETVELEPTFESSNDEEIKIPPIIIHLHKS